MEYLNRFSVIYFFILHICEFKLISAANVVIETAVPVNPVKTGGILSLHCRIWNLESNHQVQIYRKLTGKHSEMVSVDEYVLQNIEDRVFLASRQLEDGSSVYFLSVTDITKSDQGTYSCKVVGSNEEDDTITLGRSLVNIDVHFFPTDSYPVCSPNEGLTLTEGELTTLNCSSEIANPIPDITWIKTGDGEIQSGVTVRNGVVYSELRIVPTLADKGKMFLCQLTSPMFPDVVQSCHVGPLEVLRNPKYVPAPVTNPPQVKTNALVTPSIETTLTLKRNCLKSCPSSISSPVSFWIIATAVAGVFALTFLFLGVILVIKYNRMNQGRRKQLPPHLNREYIYSELEHKPAESQLYMSLEKRGDKLSGPPCVGQLKGHYHVASLVKPS